MSRIADFLHIWIQHFLWRGRGRGRTHTHTHTHTEHIYLYRIHTYFSRSAFEQFWKDRQYKVLHFFTSGLVTKSHHWIISDWFFATLENGQCDLWTQPQSPGFPKWSNQGLLTKWCNKIPSNLLYLQLQVFALDFYFDVWRG